MCKNKYWNVLVRATLYRILCTYQCKAGGGGRQGMGWGFDCLCWPWGKAFEKILFSRGRGYLNLSSPDVGPTWGWI